MTALPPFRTFLTPAQRRGDTDFTAIAKLAKNIHSTAIQPLNPPRRGQALTVAAALPTRKKKKKPKKPGKERWKKKPCSPLHSNMS